MAFSPRVDMHGRVGAEKARLPDETITRSQLIPGQNISFDYLSNWDIKINAHLGNAGGSEGADCCKRMLTTVVTLGNKIMPGSEMEFAAGHKDAELITNTFINRFFGTVYWMDIVHNWNLDNPNSFLANVIDESKPATNNGNISLKSHVKLCAVSEDCVRLYVAVPKQLAPAKNGSSTTASYTGTPHWRANEYSKVGQDYFTAGEYPTRTFRITLQEYK